MQGLNISSNKAERQRGLRRHVAGLIAAGLGFSSLEELEQAEVERLLVSADRVLQFASAKSSTGRLIAAEEIGELLTCAFCGKFPVRFSEPQASYICKDCSEGLEKVYGTEAAGRTNY